MTDLSIAYGSHQCVRELVMRIQYCAEGVSLEFESWEDPHVRGPGLYFAVVSDHEYGTFADPMGENRWPRGECSSVYDEEDFVRATRRVAVDNDGGVVVAVDGEIEPRMVRFRDLQSSSVESDSSHDVAYEPWMGSRHMSAIETSLRPEVVATVTLSEETGRVSVFRDGEILTLRRTELGGRWRVD